MNGLNRDKEREMNKIAQDKHSRFILDTHGKPLHSAAREGIYLLNTTMNERKDLVH
jgi:fructose-1-phosphate kinase PfkB-like protein